MVLNELGSFPAPVGLQLRGTLEGDGDFPSGLLGSQIPGGRACQKVLEVVIDTEAMEPEFQDLLFISCLHFSRCQLFSSDKAGGRDASQSLC